MYSSDEFSATRRKPLGRQPYVIRPEGRVLTVQDLPRTDAVRWVKSRKADLVAAVLGGLLSLKEACRKYRLSPEEFRSWQKAIAQSGESGLHVTRPNGARRNLRESTSERRRVPVADRPDF